MNTQKIISLAFFYYDGQKNDEQMTADQKERAIEYKSSKNNFN